MNTLTDKTLAVALNLGVHPNRVTDVQEWTNNRAKVTLKGVWSRITSATMLQIDPVTAQEASQLMDQLEGFIEQYINPRHETSVTECWEPSIVAIAFEVTKATQKIGAGTQTDQALLSVCAAVLEWNRLTIMMDNKTRNDPFKRDGRVAAEWIALTTLMGLSGTNAILYLLGRVRPRFTDTGVWIVESYQGNKS